MKRLSLSLLLVFAISGILALNSCTADYAADIEAAQQKIDEMNKNLSSLEALTANLGALRNVFVIAQAGDPIVSVTAKDDGYAFLFKNNGEVVVPGKTSGISVGKGDDSYFWTLSGQPLKDGEGNDAAISLNPDFRIRNGKIEISTDGKKTWKEVDATAGSVVEKVEDGDDAISVTFLGGTVVDFPKESRLLVSLSGDGSTMATEGTATVDFHLTGKTGEYTVTPLVSEGWNADVVWENATKGKIIFTAPAPAADAAARVFFCDGIGNMVASDIDFAGLTVDESFPVMYPAWEAYNIGAEGGVVDVTLYTNRDDYQVEIENDAAWLTRAETRAVREDIISFAAIQNESEQMRSALVTITSGDYAQKVVIWQDAVLPAETEDLSAIGTANCYIVTREGDYSFNAKVMGNGDEGYIAGVDFPTETTELFPKTVDKPYDPNGVIENVTIEVSSDETTATVKFHATGNKGSAVITVKDNRYIRWSWHIWCTDRPKDRTHTNPDQLQFTFMDRNLGATSADPADGEATYGMYFQWGRKDPLDREQSTSKMATNTSHAFVYSIRYPNRAYSQDGNTEGNWYTGKNNYFWGNPDYGRNRYLKDLKKTIYDPCPVGYMVPPANAFLIFNDQKRAQFTDAGIIIHGDYGQTNFFPWAGRLYQNLNTIGSEVAYWHSCAARIGVSEDAGGAQTRVDRASGIVYLYQGDIRARVLPIRCVKQVSE